MHYANRLGPDGLAGTLDDDLRVAAVSPYIDAGNTLLVPPDTLDLDGDGNVVEPTPLDLPAPGDSSMIGLSDLGRFSHTSEPKAGRHPPTAIPMAIRTSISPTCVPAVAIRHSLFVVEYTSPITRRPAMDNDETIPTLAPPRLGALARAAVEAARYASPERERVQTALVSELKAFPDPRARTAALKEIEPMLARPAAASAASDGGSNAAPGEDRNSVSRLLAERASLQNRIAGDDERLKALERDLAAERDNHRHAVETLTKQRNEIRQLQEQRDTLSGERDRLDGALRLQKNETEQERAERDKLRNSRQVMSDKDTKLMEENNALRGENERLRAELERLRQEYERSLGHAQIQTASAESQSADAVFAELWSEMRAFMGEKDEDKEADRAKHVFVRTHVPDRRTFDRLAETFTFLLKVVLDLENLMMETYVADARNTREESRDSMSQLYVMLSKTPSITSRMREMLATGKGEGPLKQRISIVYALCCAFPAGLRNILYQSDRSMTAKLDFRNWGLGPTPKDAALGEHFRTKVRSTLPSEVNAELRKLIGPTVFAEYEVRMRQPRR